MTSISLHPTPSTRTVAIEQFRAVGLALRTEALLFIGALIVLGTLVIANAVRMVQLHPAGEIHMGINYGAVAAIPVFLMALLIPFGVWRSEDPARRTYHWSMPVARGPHTVVKLLSGWAWMMIASAVYLLFIIILATVVPTITGEANRLGNASAWEWVVAFTAPTLAYLLTSIAVIGSNHAWRWIGGLFIGYWVLIGFLSAFWMHDLAQALRTISNGTYGLSAALFGSVSHSSGNMEVGVTREMMRESSVRNWLIAMPLWIIGSGIAVTIASYRHRE
jgi:hypothetical protein